MPYIGCSMSINAKAAHERGLFPISQVRREILDQNQFPYPIAFFQWLCRERYIAPSEFHHTGAGKRLTKFYSGEQIRRFAKRANLPYLEKIFRKEITKKEALLRLGLKYYKIMFVGKLIGSKSSKTIKAYAIYYNKVYYLSVKLKILEKNVGAGQLSILEEYAKSDEEWKNQNTRAIERSLLLYASKYGDVE